MTGTCPHLKCAKWSKQHDGSYICSQDKDNKCGCLSNIASTSVNIILSKEQIDDRNDYINEIKNSINNETLALITGAGISKPSKMPLWTDLISRMMGYAIQYNFMEKKHLTTEDSAFFSNLNDLSSRLIKGELKILSNVNPLESAEYVAQFLDDASFIDDKRDKLPDISIKTMIRRIIKHSLPPSKLLMKELRDTRNSGLGLPDELMKYNGNGSIASVIKNIEQENAEKYLSEIASLNTMFAVSYLMYHEKGVRQTMTYNFEPLVQEHLLDLYGLNNEKILTHPGKFSSTAYGSKDDLREIYHVHGFVPGERHTKRNIPHVFPEESDYIILSEDSYYRVEKNEAYNWSSSIQSYFLNKYNCLFVGFSADDYNFRRILRQTRSIKPKPKSDFDDKKKHFLVIPINDWVRNIYENICHMSINTNTKIGSDLLNRISENALLVTQQVLKCREEYWKRFNIFPIWVTVEEIPKLLASFINP